MRRAVLSLALAVFTGMGPWLCCCATAQISLPTTPVDPESVCDANHCCCDQKPVSQPAKAPAKSPKPCSDCGQCRPVAYFQESPLPEWDDALTGWLPIDAVAAVECHVVRTVIASWFMSPDTIFPFVSAKDFLYHCHILRC
jgi:hypothetical protein